MATIDQRITILFAALLCLVLRPPELHARGGGGCVEQGMAGQPRIPHKVVGLVLPSPLERVEVSFGDDVRSHPFIAALIEKAQFSPSDAWAVFMELNAEWQYRVQVVANIAELSDGERLEFDNTVRAMYGTRALTKVWYQTHGRNLNPEVVAYVDRLLQSPNHSMVHLGG